MWRSGVTAEVSTDAARYRAAVGRVRGEICVPVSSSGRCIGVLNAETTVLQQRKLATDLQARRLDAQMALIKALGGGYTAEDLPGAKPETAASHG